MNVRTVDYADPQAGQQFVDSLRHTGFAVLTNHPIPKDLLKRVYDGWLAFFKSDEKYDFVYDPDSPRGTQEGFIPMDVSETAVGYELKDLKEFYHIVPEGRVPPALKADILDYRVSAFNLGRELVDWIQQHAPASVTEQLSESLSGMLSDEHSMLRVLHYPPLENPQQQAAVRAAAHEDINIITVLPASEQPGLQVKGSDGEWLDLASRQGDLIVNTGDMLSEATANYFPSTTHRVVNPAGEDDNISRVSAPYFLAARPEVVLSERYTAGSYLAERIEEINA